MSSSPPDLKVVEMQVHTPADIAASLRRIAQRIEERDPEYGDCHNLAWVLDCGGGVVRIGFLGLAAHPGAEAHLLFALAQHQVERSALNMETE